MLYVYHNIYNIDTTQVHIDISASEILTDKNIIGCAWKESTKILKINWASSISTADKDELDSIIQSNQV